MGCAACEVPEHSLRLRTDDRRTDPRLRLRMAAPLTSSPVAAPLAQAHPGVGTFVAGTGRGDLRARSIMRTDAQSCAELESPARGHLIQPDANFLLRQRCARVRAPNTQPATRPLTATVPHEPEHRARTSGMKSPARAPIRPASLEIRAPQLSSQERDVGIFRIGRMRTHMRSRAQNLNPRARGHPNMNMAGCEFSPATVVRPDAPQWKRTRSLAAYCHRPLLTRTIAIIV